LVPDEDKAQFFTPEVVAGLSGHSAFDVYREVMRGADLPLQTNEDFVNTSLYFELKTFLHGLLVIEDKLSMSHSLETRVPFLDNDLVEFALKVPAKYKLRSLEGTAGSVDENEAGKRIKYDLRTGEGKTVLRKAMARIIPDNITDRVKQGFVAPDASWYRGDSIDYINGLLRNPHARIYEYLNPSYISARLDEHTGGQVNRRLFIWGLLSFEWWLKQFMPA
jgi:asparagine synthase (glutamine-hydrolysing)